MRLLLRIHGTCDGVLSSEASSFQRLFCTLSTQLCSVPFFSVERERESLSVCYFVYVFVADLVPAYDACATIELTSQVFAERQRFSADGFR